MIMRWLMVKLKRHVQVATVGMQVATLGLCFRCNRQVWWQATIDSLEKKSRLICGSLCLHRSASILRASARAPLREPHMRILLGDSTSPFPKKGYTDM